ncbi:MAG: tRNA lysidine(34) synthetase TilS, partial [Burkholderiales bacterium]|nr:tRNA lysidine(34) synthetase TilS [Burkholderiales bacterium]
MLPRVAVAASGGRDSTALLHCTARAARALGAEVVALHVHHGLQAEADDWLELVRRQARRWSAEFACQRLLGKPARGASVEAWARTERYRALAELAHASGCGLVLLAHHRRDQAETWLLQALRGAGAAGLAAMPARAERAGLTWVRPWLDQPREAIEAYVRRHRLRHAEDPSNGDPRYARNRLRLQVWPALTAAFPEAEAALAAAAAQAQDAAALAAQLAAQDLARLCEGPALRV